MFARRQDCYLTSILLVFLLPSPGLADMSGTVTLSTGSTFNLDAGSTPGCTPDIGLAGGQISPSGAATLYLIPGSGGYDSLTLANLKSLSYQHTPISPAVNTVFAVNTNGGNYAKVLITGASATSVTLQYTTYGATQGAPVILRAVNNYSYASVAPGSIFTIFGCGLATPESQAVLAPLSGSGSLSVGVATLPQPVTIPGLDAAYVIGYATPLSSVSVNYQ